MRKRTAAIVSGVFLFVFNACGNEAELIAEGWKNDFSEFDGTFASLPAGVAVSKDGLQAMPADDVDFRGMDDGSLTTGGCYAWDTGGGDRALGCQPNADDFTPGWFMVAFSNSTAREINFLKISYDMVWLNNEGRSQKLAFLAECDGLFSLSVPELEGVTGEAADGAAAWRRVRLECCVRLPAPVPVGGVFALKWVVDDAGGTGSRDEYGIDNISVKGLYERGTVISVR